LNIARAERKRNNLITARQHTENALDLIESLRTIIASEEWRASYLASKRDYYEFYIDLLMRLHQEFPSNGHDAAALQASERARARSLLETLSEARFDIRQGVDSQLLAREHELQKQINNKDMQRMQLLSGMSNEVQTQKIEKELNALLTDYGEVRAQIRAHSPRYAALTQPEPLSLREIQRQILDEDTLLLEYALGEERSYLWVVTQSDLMSFVLPKRAVVELAARRVYELLTSSHKIEARRASELAAIELSRIVLEPAAALLKKKRLLIVSEGALQYVPFAALSLPEEWGSYEPLINRYEVISLPSASVLAVLRREMSDRQAAPKAVAVLADAVFQNDDARLKNAKQASVVRPDDQLADQNDLMRSASESGVINFQRLPFTRQEAEAIVSQAGESKSLKALDFDASRDTIFDIKLDQYGIIHFATHGLLNSQHPELSGIVLSLVDKNGRPKDGFLRTHDIYNLKLQANLVVLSACRTALGSEVKGEGLLGLTRGFMYSGAPRVVASLWDVKDEATAKLMRHFYQKMLRDGLRPAAALRAAQVMLLKEPRWQAPYYWAGFTLQGDWK
jgi:CHAT domain-containing protein